MCFSCLVVVFSLLLSLCVGRLQHLWAALTASLYDSLDQQFGERQCKLFRAKEHWRQSVSVNWPRLFLCLLLAALLVLGLYYWAAQSDVGVWLSRAGAAVAGVVALFPFVSPAITFARNLLISRSEELRAATARLDLSSKLGFMGQIKDEIAMCVRMMNQEPKYVTDPADPFFVEGRSHVAHRSKFVIMVDDLDRCPAEKAVDVLKALILLLSDKASPFIVVLAIDPRFVVRVLPFFPLFSFLYCSLCFFFLFFLVSLFFLFFSSPFFRLACLAPIRTN